MIVFDNVSKYYGDVRALEDISFEIGTGEFVTIVGYSGAGKTNIFKLILGEEISTDGVLTYNGIDINSFTKKELLNYRRSIGVIFQDFRLLKTKTVYENIAFAMEALGFEDTQIESDVPYVLDLVNLTDKMWSFPEELSGGEKQRVAIARAIVNHPALLIADEPTGNLDPVHRYEVINILKQINKLGTTIILATHDKDIVESVGGRVLTVSEGKIISDNPNGKYVL